VRVFQAADGRSRFLLIDALRGLAALAVVFFHAHEGRHIDALSAALPRFLAALIARGDLGVQVFFVLSGFVIAHSMSRHEVTVGYVGRFLLRRSIRLDPPYWLSMVLVVALGVLSARYVAGKTFELPDWRRLLVHVLYLQDLLRVKPLNPIYWTLCIEIQFYATFALLMWVATRLRRRVSAARAFYAVMLPAALVADCWPPELRPFGVREIFLPHWHLFIAGVLVWWAVVARPEDRVARALAVGNLVLLAGIAAFRAEVALAVGVAAAALIFVAGWRQKLALWLSARPLQVLGAISYSLYLTHNPITGAAFRLGYRLTGRTLFTEALWLVLVVAVCLGFALLFHLAIERPSLALGHRLSLGGRRDGGKGPRAP
jgi:peptidoglycan/LPS O-acetylase OafA/YrhL